MTESTSIMTPLSHEQLVKELHEACTTTNIPLVRGLFYTGRLSAADATREFEHTWYHTSCETRTSASHVSLMRCLLEHDADPNVLRIRRVDSFDVLKLLVEFGYDIRTQGHLILQDFAESREILDWLLDQGVDINLTDTTRLADGFYINAFEETSLKVLNRVAANGDIQLFDHLVSQGADPTRSLALHHASECKDPARATAMISHLVDEHHLDINADSDNFNNFFQDLPDFGTPLNSAIYNENLPAVQELLRKGACVEFPRRDPAFHAIGIIRSEGYLPALECLLDAGADSTEALRFAVYKNHLEAARICLEKGANPDHVLEEEQVELNQAAIAEWGDRETYEKTSEEMRKLFRSWEHVGEGGSLDADSNSNWQRYKRSTQAKALSILTIWMPTAKLRRVQRTMKYDESEEEGEIAAAADGTGEPGRTVIMFEEMQPDRAQ